MREGVERGPLRRVDISLYTERLLGVNTMGPFLQDYIRKAFGHTFFSPIYGIVCILVS